MSSGFITRGCRLVGWAAGGVIDSFCDTKLGVRLLFDMVEWPDRGLVEQCS